MSIAWAATVTLSHPPCSLVQTVLVTGVEPLFNPILSRPPYNMDIYHIAGMCLFFTVMSIVGLVAASVLYKKIGKVPQMCVGLVSRMLHHTNIPVAMAPTPPGWVSLGSTAPQPVPTSPLDGRSMPGQISHVLCG